MHPAAALAGSGLWIPSPESVFGWLLPGALWVLGSTSPAFGWLAYITGCVWLTRRLLRQPSALAIDDGHPVFHPPVWAGVHPWLLLGWMQLAFIVMPAALGFFLPQALAESVWRHAYAPSFGDVRLGVLGQLSQWVGAVCGLLIGLCRRDVVLGAVVVGGGVSLLLRN